MITESEIKKGHAIYTPFWLKFYNIWVLDISNRWIWRCHKKTQLAQFNQFLSANHLDIGVGTGYYLNACGSSAISQLALMDLNPNCLQATTDLLIARGLKPKTYLADIFKPQPELVQQFNSISMNYLLHCLPGTMQIKEQCIANATTMLKPGGVLFGATILYDDILQTKASRALLGFYNKKGIFSNQKDLLQTLEDALKKYLIEVHVLVIGCVALFHGKKQ